MKQDLTDWIVEFVKNKDAFFKRIEKIDPSTQGACITYKDQSTEQIIVDPFLEDVDTWISTITNNHKTMVVIANAKKTREQLLTNWEKFVEHPKLCVYAVNPHTDGEKKWIVCPHTHNKICDPKTLKQGIDSLSEPVADL